MQRIHDRLLVAHHLVTRPRLRNIVAPIFQVHPVGENQVGHDTGFIDERGEADNKQVVGILQSAPHLQGIGEAKHRVGVVQQQEPGFPALDVLGGLGPVVQGCHLGS